MREDFHPPGGFGLESRRPPSRRRARRLGRAIATAAIAGCLSVWATARALGTVPALASTGAATAAYDGVVEAVRQSVVAAQVAGAVVELRVQAGDRVTPGQVLVRIDARAAQQNAAANEAQVQAARAGLELAERDFARQRQLFEQHFISAAALERAESALKAARAQAAAQLAQADAARTQSSFHVVKAPFAGVVAEVPVALGDMAMPGRALLTLYDPSALRVAAALPQSAAARRAMDEVPRIALSGPPGDAAMLTPTRVQWLPALDASTHTVTLRADLPSGSGAVPGMFARVWLTLADGAAGRAGTVSVPRQAVVRRAEMTALYVLDPSGRPLLRQVRLGPVAGDRIEILAGLSAGERVVLDPEEAARGTAPP